MREREGEEERRGEERSGEGEVDVAWMSARRLITNH
jgi:hypothetical protein